MNYWPRLQRHLTTNGSPNDIVDLKDLFGDQLSPLPPGTAKIQMNDEFSLAQFMEVIVRNFIDQRLNLRVSTWSLIRKLYEAVERNPGDPARQKAVEVLLIISKLDVEEYYRLYYRRDAGLPAFCPSVCSSVRLSTQRVWLSARRIQRR